MVVSEPVQSRGGTGRDCVQYDSKEAFAWVRAEIRSSSHADVADQAWLVLRGREPTGISGEEIGQKIEPKSELTD